MTRCMMKDITGSASMGLWRRALTTRRTCTTSGNLSRNRYFPGYYERIFTSEASVAREWKHPPTDRRNFSRGAIMLLPDRNHLTQVSTTCSSCIYHIGSLPLTPPRGSLRFASRRPSSTCRRRRTSYPHTRSREEANLNG
ncbi:uncharacterized protein LOC112453779 isoform X2 [Temnothorax curvispinosus]|uniref:Uncharacterized protein LOC112453779 isoform X2 n=1 Tax=Temnothorax curvispinosus TaxID=300111 RepID=A0A6J1PLD3_9HYME|nr:uncharacterized protein LOC112453779 isoform X2 [Temnothorax curvispinosus]